MRPVVEHAELHTLASRMRLHIFRHTILCRLGSIMPPCAVVATACFWTNQGAWSRFQDGCLHVLRFEVSNSGLEEFNGCEQAIEASDLPTVSASVVEMLKHRRGQDVVRIRGSVGQWPRLDFELSLSK